MSALGTRRGATAGRAVALVAVCGLAFAPVHAQVPESQSIQVRASVDPGSVLIGERATYRGRVVFRSGPTFRWLPPEAHPDLRWGGPRPRLARGSGAASWDTLVVEVPVQAFRLGPVSIPGLRYEDPAHPGVRRLPAVNLLVRSVLAAGDSNAELRPARGPLEAPWWERVPWGIVLLVLLAVAALIALVRWLRARRRTPAERHEPEILDPAARALAELAELRALRLPAQGRFAEHAFHLTRILRRYLEAVTHVPRPGHTTPELVAALARTRLGPDDVHQLAALLRIWDRLKFARAASTVEECIRFEEAVEVLVRNAARSTEGMAA